MRSLSCHVGHFLVLALSLAFPCMFSHAVTLPPIEILLRCVALVCVISRVLLWVPLWTPRSALPFHSVLFFCAVRFARSVLSSGLLHGSQAFHSVLSFFLSSVQQSVQVVQMRSFFSVSLLNIATCTDFLFHKANTAPYRQRHAEAFSSCSHK